MLLSVRKEIFDTWAMNIKKMISEDLITIAFRKSI